ncbi:hypothetical protein GCM10011409_41280 [Lentibacillus populi]|uniref:PRC-barrel domain-containing protein n=1 Tax=Lentibacillus populi TaxID=1827502 RepID=A0A9W5U1S4_9BACI|nr:hypothetical protein [Lentibacillus populi]GGB59598.1 hypothetical protein GCM10011409_41280 [Lentibacillus populi]
MLYFSSELKNYRIDATDGEMGKMQDLYFDDRKWAIRYCIVDTRKWLPGRKVLLSPASFEHVNELDGLVEVNLDKETIRNSPSIHEGEPITRDTEFTLAGYYGWSRYWLGNMLWGGQDQPFTPLPDMKAERTVYQDPLHENNDYELRSEAESIGIRAHANDGRLGTVVDFIFDDEYWKIRCLIIEGIDVPATKLYLIKMEMIQSVDWLEEDLYVDCTTDMFSQEIGYESRKEIMKNL